MRMADDFLGADITKGGLTGVVLMEGTAAGGTDAGGEVTTGADVPGADAAEGGLGTPLGAA